MTTKKILNKSIEALLNSQVILYPTDTVWGLGCDATNIDAVAKIFKLKELCKEFINNGEKALIWSTHLKTIDLIERELSSDGIKIKKITKVNS